MQSKSILSCLVWGFVAAFNHSKVPGNETSCDHQSGDDVGELSDFYGPVSSEHKRKIRVGDENADLCCMPLSSARQVIHLMKIIGNGEVLCMADLLAIWLARIMLLFGLQCIVFILRNHWIRSTVHVKLALFFYVFFHLIEVIYVLHSRVFKLHLGLRSRDESECNGCFFITISFFFYNEGAIPL